MKIVCVSDLHLDKETLGVSRMVEVERALRQAVSLLHEIDAELLLCLGDIADPDNGGATLHAIQIVADVARGLKERGKRSIWIAGNHDVVEDGSGATVLSPLCALEGDTEDTEGVVVAESPRLVPLADGVVLLALPYTAVARAYDPAKEARRLLARAGGRVIVAGHLMIPGIIPGEETLEMARGRGDESVIFPIEETTCAAMRLNGHFHKRQDFDPGDGGPPIHIPGSPAVFSFGEEKNTPAFSVITI